MAGDETVLDGGWFATDIAGYRAMLTLAKRFPDRTWAVEGCQGIGRHIANRLIADGESVVDVPAKLSARVRVFATGQGRKTDATDAHSVAQVGTRMSGLRPVVDDEQLTVLRLLVDRRRALGEDHTRMIAQLHQLLLELIPGGAKKDLSAGAGQSPAGYPTSSTASCSPTRYDHSGRAREDNRGRHFNPAWPTHTRHRHFGSVTSRTPPPTSLEPHPSPRLDTEGGHVG